MHKWKGFRQHWYLIAATAAILAATFALVLMQYRSARRTEAQARALLEANLDLHLLALVAEARRDLVEHADHVAHSVYQQLVRDRDIPGLQRYVTRAAHRFPEIRDFYVVFFAPRQERETWRALHFAPAAPGDTQAPQYNGTPLGKFVEDADAAAPLLAAWLSVAERASLATSATFAPVSLAQPEPRQIFFHPVYEGERIAPQPQLAPVGLIVLAVAAATYPAPDYWRDLLARHAERAAGQGLSEQPVYQVSVNERAAQHILASVGEMKTPLRQRGFLAADGLFPTLLFQVAPHETRFAQENAGLSLLLGLCAAALALAGVGMTWRAVQRERKVAQLKSDFLASISHELKTPLTAIRAFGDLLHSGRVRNTERIHEYGGLIKTESDRLTALINNILELSRLERGVRRYRLEDGTLCAVVAETAEVFRHSPEAQGFTIELTLPAPPLRARFDESAIRQATLNLLANAVRYAGPGDAARRIEVTVRRAPGEAVIEVCDHGIGIAAPEQRRIFTPFYRTPNAASQTERGLGIGLAIVREIVEAHGGEISVESEPGAGATFRLHLPLPEAGPGPAAANAAAQTLRENS
ncbi:MAG: sensor histidine kinase [Blastocatellia bacterium]